MTKRTRLTDTERARRRDQDRQRVKQAAEQLLSSDGWQRWVRVRAQGGLARLSLNNQLLVALACPQATFVAGFKTWLKLGYCPVKGSRAIRIIAPMPIKLGDQQQADEHARRLVLFKGVPVFDRSQVDPIDGVQQAPVQPPCEPLSGDSHAQMIAPMQAFAESLGYSVAFESIPGATGGWCDQKHQRIIVDADQPANARLRVLIHETGHALGVGYSEHGRERAEVIVDTAAYIAAASVGLDLSGESVPYVAGWGENGELDAVTTFAGLIDDLARQLEAALHIDSEEPDSGHRPADTELAGVIA